MTASYGKANNNSYYLIFYYGYEYVSNGLCLSLAIANNLRRLGAEYEQEFWCVGVCGRCFRKCPQTATASEDTSKEC